MRPRIFLADDHTLLLDAFAKLLEPECEIVGTAQDERSLVKQALALKLDIILLDVGMPLLNGIEAGQQLKRRIPQTRLIFLTQNEDPDLCRYALENGASGYLLKTVAAAELLEAIRIVLKGRAYVTPRMAEALDSLFEQCGPKSLKPQRLTPRQREVLQLLAEGCLMKQVAAELGMTKRTVAFHKYRIMNSHHLRSNADLVRFAMEQGLGTTLPRSASE